MNINGMARSYMSKHMKKQEFLKFVLRLMERVFNENGEDISITYQEFETGYTIYFTSQHDWELLTLPRSELIRLKLRSPYSLDRYLWNYLKAGTFEIEWKAPYLKFLNLD